MTKAETKERLLAAQERLVERILAEHGISLIDRDLKIKRGGTTIIVNQNGDVEISGGNLKVGGTRVALVGYETSEELSPPTNHTHTIVLTED